MLNSPDIQKLNDYLFKYLQDVLYSPSAAELNLNFLPEELQRFGEGLQFFGQCATETSAMAKALSKGILNGPLPSRYNEMAAPLKSLHASLRHLTWQTKQVAQGDYNQRVDFMGDFSDAFNSMVQQLDERWKTLESLYRRNASYIKLIQKIGTRLLSIGYSSYKGTVIHSLRDLSETFDCVDASLWKVDRNGNYERLFCWSADTENASLPSKRRWPKEWIDTLAAGKCVSIAPLSHMPDLFSKEVSSFTAIPLTVHGNFWGFLAFGGRNVETYPEEAMSVMTASGILIISAILMKEMTDSLVTAKQNALRTAQAKSEFLSHMSHEIRTPINAIIGMGLIAEETDDLNKLRFCLSRINTSAAHLLNLINDVLDISKIEAGKLRLHASRFDMGKTLGKICDIITPQADLANQTVRITMGRETERFYVGDEMRLSQALINIISNAVKFTPEHGKILISVKEVRRKKTCSRLRFSVSDSGIGMTPEQKRRLFDAFSQGDTGITSHYGGTGLGLVISKRIVELMHGEIDVVSESGKGSTFVFDIELGRDPKEDSAADSVEQPGFRALVADGDVESGRHLRNTLERFGGIVDTVETGEDAARQAGAAARCGNPYDIIFVEHDLPGGIETVRSFDPDIDRNTIVMTATLLQWNRVKSGVAEAGIRRFLAKPTLPATVRGALRELVKDETGAAPEQSQKNLPAPDLSGRHILLVDDVEINRLIVRELLAGTNVVIGEAENGETALDMFAKSPEGYYDLVFMDIQMSGIDGLETTRWLRKMPRQDARKVPVVAMTAGAYNEDMEQQSGQTVMNAYLAKPININEMRDLLKRLLKKSDH